jgi:hypothetical protein
MRVIGTSFYAAGWSLVVSLSCTDHDTRPSSGSDSSAGTAGAKAGEGGTTQAEGGGAGDGGEMPTGSGAASSEGGEAGAPIASSGASGEAGGRATASPGGAGGEGGTNTAGDAGIASATGAAGTPPRNATAEHLALCASICAKEPLTNGFAGAPTAPCPNNENCVETICGMIESYSMPNEFCLDRFTAVLTCWDSLPDEAYDCHSVGLLLPFGCYDEEATWMAACRSD